jgi:hypothetical protein
MELTLSILVGLGLSAACGYRVFVPFLVLSVASMSGHVTLAHGFEWIGTPYALTAFGVATALEVLAYYIPWLDNLLDVAATPAAVAAGILITASVVGDVSPFLRWSLAVVAGGGAAGVVQAATVALRGTSSVATGGAGNPVIATGELGGAAVTSVLAVVVPVAAVVMILLLLTLIFRLARRGARAL